MIVCHCQNITDRDIHSAIDWMRAADPETIITPGKLFRALGKAADCGANGFSDNVVAGCCARREMQLNELNSDR